MLNNLDETYNKVISEIINFCKVNFIKAYIVGGAVRDYLLNIPLKDIDICFEMKDIFEILQHLEDKLKIEYKYYKEFQTSTIYYKNHSLDLIICRKEIYKENGKLPIVSSGTLYDDLKRRDFTINSLAYDLMENKIIDYFCGKEDLKKGIIKKIHSCSYEEDATRIFRAIKYASRLDFKIFDETEIKELISENILASITNDRILKEIILLLSENCWLISINYLIYMSIITPKEDFQGFGNMDTDNLKETFQRIIYLCYISKKEKAIEAVIENSILNKNFRVGIAEYYSTNIIYNLKKAKENFQIYSSIKPLKATTLDILQFHKELKYKIINYRNNLENFTFKLTGKDVVANTIEKGPYIGEYLKIYKKQCLNTLISVDKKHFIEKIGDIKNGIKH